MQNKDSLTTNLERAKALVEELRELMRDPEVFRTIGETFFDDAEPCEGYESMSDVIDSYANGEIIYCQAGIYFSKMPMIWRDDGDDGRTLLYGDEAEKEADMPDYVKKSQRGCTMTDNPQTTKIRHISSPLPREGGRPNLCGSDQGTLSSYDGLDEAYTANLEGWEKDVATCKECLQVALIGMGVNQ